MGSREYLAVVEGDITKRYSASVPTDIDRNRTRFMVVGHLRGSYCVTRASMIICQLMRTLLLVTFLFHGSAVCEEERFFVWTSDGSVASFAIPFDVIEFVSAEDSPRYPLSQGDACDLPAKLPQFDAVLAANLVCRLPEPLKFLDRLPSLVK